jgi:hypothetical protein
MSDSKLQARPAGQAIATAEELPVVARLVIEIRSDGSRTVARGVLEDRIGGETVSLDTEGATPGMLALQLLGSLEKLPMFTRLGAARAIATTALRAILPRRKT